MIRLLFVVSLLTGVLSMASQDIYVREGELVALKCQQRHRAGDRFVWKSGNGKIYSHNTSDVEQRKMKVMLHGNNLVILSASDKHQGNYSCLLRNTSSQSWFRLTVYATRSKEHEEKTLYPKTCFKEESCILICPDVNSPSANILNLNNIDMWQKPDGDFVRSRRINFASVMQKDSGVYTCIKNYLYEGQLYNQTIRVVLDVKQKEEPKKFARIIEPKENEVFYVDLGAPKMIDCKAVMFSEFDEISWLSDESFVEKNNSLMIFYNESLECGKDEKKVTASLVFKKVSEQDLKKRYTCKFSSDHQLATFVTVTLSRKAGPSYVPLAACSVCLTLVLVLTVVFYAKFKVDITLFLRDTVGCRRRISDGKSFDVFMMSYRSETGAGLSADDGKMLESVLEERLGYILCLFDRDVLPGESVAEAVLDCIQQSRTVVLVPTSSYPTLESEVLSAIHAALVERQTRLVFINADTIEVWNEGSIPEALQRLIEAGGHVTWRGRSSMMLSSSFWKQLRYYLPAPRQKPKIKQLPQTIYDVDSR